MNLKNLCKVADSPLSLRDELISLLAEEFQAWYQYKIVIPYITGDSRPDVKEFFEEAADDELNDHAEQLMKRIAELDLVNSILPTPESWALAARAKFQTAPLDITSQLQINLTAEEEAIAHYHEVINMAESLQDFVTADILKKILADENEHKHSLEKLIQDLTE